MIRWSCDVWLGRWRKVVSWNFQICCFIGWDTSWTRGGWPSQSLLVRLVQQKIQPGHHLFKVIIYFSIVGLDAIYCTSQWPRGGYSFHKDKKCYWYGGKGCLDIFCFTKQRVISFLFVIWEQNCRPRLASWECSCSRRRCAWSLWYCRRKAGLVVRHHKSKILLWNTRGSQNEGKFAFFTYLHSFG